MIPPSKAYKAIVRNRVVAEGSKAAMKKWIRLKNQTLDSSGIDRAYLGLNPSRSIGEEWVQ